MNLLFTTVIDEHGREVSSLAVAERLSQVLGRPVAEEDIDALRGAEAQRPGDGLLLALAQYFDMPGTFLSDDPDEYSTMYVHLKLLITQRDQGVPYLALRTATDHLSNEAVEELTGYIEEL